MRNDPPQHFPSLLGLIYPENDVFSAVGGGTRAQHGRLYVACFNFRNLDRGHEVFLCYTYELD